ncbi:MAG: RHS repeat-associated core domain-containing protein, partial [Gammaproteobacteria bacterium]
MDRNDWIDESAISLAISRVTSAVLAVVLILLTGAFGQSSAAAQLVGTPNGKLSVDPTGAANYQIPIETPPGVAGVTPELALVYNSRSGNGLMGMGWSLSGLSAVSRCPATIPVDGFYDGTDLDDNDRFCLDGQRLIDQGNGSYRTEVETFKKIRRQGVPGSCTTTFRVQDASGMTREYGGTDDSCIETENAGQGLTWAVSRISDIFGNFIAFEYGNDATTSEYWPTKVTYGSGKASVAEVRFDYSTNRPDVFYAYVAGTQTGVKRRLTNVKTYSQSTLVHDYRLTYRQGSKSNRSQLQTVTQCDVFNDCLPGVEFLWQQGARGFTTGPAGSLNSELEHSQFLDMDADGFLDIAYYGANSIFVFRGGPVFTTPFNSGIQITPDQAENLKVLDYNGDGLSDLAYPNNPQGGSTWVILQSRGLDPVTGSTPCGGDPVPCPTNVFFETITTSLLYPGSENSTFLDADGDGRSDFLYSTNNQFRLYLNGPSGISGTLTDSVLASDRPAPNNRASINLNRGGVNLDGDGRDDYLGYRCEPQIDSPCMNNDDHYFVKVSYNPLPSGGGNLTATEIPGIAGAKITKRANFVDINGDGITDLMYQENSANRWRFHVNSGTQFLAAQTYTVPTQASIERVQIIDYNGDGRSDVIYPSGANRWVVGLSNGTRPVGIVETGENAALATLFVDLNGDSLADLFSNPDGGSNVWSLRQQKPMMHDLLARVRKGRNAAPESYRYVDESAIYYVPATDRGFYTRVDTIPAYPYRRFAAPMYLVSHVSADTATTPDQSEPNQVFTSYHYEDGVIELGGRGFLGFREIRALNSNTATLTVNRHRLEFPYNGMLEVAEQMITDGVTIDQTNANLPLAPSEFVGSIPDICDEQDLGYIPPICSAPQVPVVEVPPPYVPPPTFHGGTLVSRITNTLDQMPSQPTGSPFPYIDEGYQEVFDLGTGSRYKRVLTDFTYNGWGNATDVVATTTNGTGGEAHVVDTTHVFQNWTGGDQWCLARLTRTEIRRTRNGGYAPTAGAGANLAPLNTNNDPRVSTFGYDPVTCQLTSETTEPSTALSMTRQHDYDRFGNRIATTITGADIETRVARTRYDNSGQFPVWEQNDLGHTETKSWDARFGVALTSTGPNGLTTTWEYDTLGRKVSETAPVTTLRNDWIYEWCETAASGCASPFALFKISMTATDVTTPDGVRMSTEHDQLGREVATNTLLLGGSFSTVENRYDPLGRTYATSAPYMGSAICWRFLIYDNLGRVIEDRSPKSAAQCTASLPAWNANDPFSGYSSVRNFAYNGFVKTLTHPEVGTPSFRRVETQIDTPLGNLRRVCEGACSSVSVQTRFDFDVYGNTTWVEDSAGNVTTTVFNKLGHKTAMNDPDMGAWSYAHNVLGELISQTDAKNQFVTQRYDTIGRMIHRLDPEGETTWVYDVGPGKGIGKLAYVSAPGGYGEGHGYDEYGRASETLQIIDGEAHLVGTSYDTLGRPSVLTYPDRNPTAVIPALPNAPGRPSVSPAGTSTSGNYTVSWSAPGGPIDQYKLFESAPDGNFPAAQRTPQYVSDTPSFDVVDRTNGSYRYKVEACNQAGCGATSLVSAPVNVDRPLGQAHAPTVQASSTGTHTVRWSAFPNASHYKLYSGTSAGGVGGSPIYQGPNLNHVHDLTVNGNFFYGVRACESSALASCGAQSLASTAVAVSLPQPVTPAAPTLSPSPSLGSHTASWQSVAGARTYNLYRSTILGDLGGSPIAQTTGLSAADSAGVGQYYYRLEACAASNFTVCSSRSGPTTLQVQPGAPNPPSFSNVNDGSVNTTWNSITGADEYVLERRFGNIDTTVYEGSSPATSDTVTVAGTYQYRARARKTGSPVINGQFGGYNSISLTPAAQTPGVPGNVGTSPQSVFQNENFSVSWNAPAGTYDTYVVESKRNSAGWQFFKETASPSTSVSGSLSQAGEYSFRVRACDGGASGTCGDNGISTNFLSVLNPNSPTNPGPKAKSGVTPDSVFSRQQQLLRSARAKFMHVSTRSSGQQPYAVTNVYATTGHLVRVESQNSILWEALAMDARGNIVSERSANNGALLSTRSYDAATGRLNSIDTGNGIQNLAYEWDAVGNLERRQDYRTSNIENFTYDTLYRLDEITLNQGPATLHAYDDIGNLTLKGDVSNYGYGNNAGPHAVTSVSLPGGGRTYQYDANGNMRSTFEGGVKTRDVTWTSFNKPNRIDNPVSGNSSDFFYSAERMRYKQVADIDGRTETTVYVGDLYERKTIDNAYVEHRHFVRAYGRVIAEITVADGGDGDADGDSIIDGMDNCQDVANPLQIDADGDRIGNYCDGDFNNDAIVNFLDISTFGDNFLSSNPVVDMNSDGTVNFLDYPLLTSGILQPPGPSGQAWPDGRARGYRVHFWLRDHLDSVSVVVDGDANVLERLSYDAWGKRRSDETWLDAPVAEFGGSDNTPRGFTGHEHLDQLGLIHMNGRIYDADIGRFLSADVFIQFPDSTQGFNRYTYTGNNPLSYADPSGHFVFALAIGIAMKTATIGQLIAAVAIGGFMDGFVASGGDFAAAFKGGVLAALGAGLANGIGTMFDGITFASDPGAFLAKAALHGISQGGLTEVGGGRFGDGFLGGFAGSVLEPITTNIRENAGPIAAVVTAATVGGTVSALSGGKFGNGDT